MSQNLFLNIYFQFLPLSLFDVSRRPWMGPQSLPLLLFFPSNLDFWGCLFLSPQQMRTRKELKIFQFILPQKGNGRYRKTKNCRFILYIPFRIIASSVCACVGPFVRTNVYAIKKGEGREEQISTLVCRIIYLLAQDVNIINI